MMLKKIFLVWLIGIIFSDCAFSLDAMTCDAECADALTVRVNVPKADWRYVNILWSALHLYLETTPGEKECEYLVERAQTLWKSAYSDRQLSLALSEFARLLLNPGAIGLKRKIRSADARTKKHVFRFNFNVHVARLTVEFSDNKTAEWRFEDVLGLDSRKATASLLDHNKPRGSCAVSSEQGSLRLPLRVLTIDNNKDPQIPAHDARVRLDPRKRMIHPTNTASPRKRLRSFLPESSPKHAPLATSPATSAVPNEAHALPTTTAPLPKIYFNEKYLAGADHVPDPGKIHSARVTRRKPTPCLSFRPLGDYPANNDHAHSQNVYVPGVISFRIFSKQPLKKIIPYQRTTMVLAGRQDLAYVPEESQTGRVILILSPFQEKNALFWLGENRDVIIVDELIDHTGAPLSQELLRRITARRLAALHVARHFGLDDFVMLDDNIWHLYASPTLDKHFKHWKRFYQAFAITSRRSKSTLVSMGALDYQRMSPNADKIHSVPNRQVAKVIYFRMDRLRSLSDQDITWLLPTRFDVCFEDIFMQIALSTLGHASSVIHLNALAYERSQKGAHAALNSLVKGKEKVSAPPSDYWLALDMEKLAGAPAFHREAADHLNSLLLPAKNRLEKIYHKRRNTDLPALTAKNYLAQKQRDDREVGSITNIEAQPQPKIAKISKPPKQKRLSPEAISSSWPASAFARAFGHDIARVFAQVKELSPEHARTPLRPHQYEGLIALRDVLHMGEKRGYFSLPTGSGKTRLFLTLLSIALDSQTFKGKNIAILVPTQDLVNQTYEAIRGFNEAMAPFGLSIPINDRVSKISSDNIKQHHLHFNEGFHNAQPMAYIFCNKSFDHLSREYPEDLHKFGLIIVDEFHVVEPNILDRITTFGRENEMVMLGFTATPDKKADYFGNAIYTMTVAEAVNAKVLVPWETRSLGGWKYKRKNDFRYYQKLVEDFLSAKLPNGSALSSSKTIIYVSSTHNAKILADMLKKNGVLVEPYTSKKSSQTNRKLLNRFSFTNNHPDQINVLIAVKMLNLGFDEKKVICVIIARRQKDLNEARQILGRAIRVNNEQPEKIALFVAPSTIAKQEDFLSYNKDVAQAPFSTTASSNLFSKTEGGNDLNEEDEEKSLEILDANEPWTTEEAMTDILQRVCNPANLLPDVMEMLKPLIATLQE